MTEIKVKLVVLDAKGDNYKKSPLWDNLDFAHIYFVTDNERLIESNYFLYRDSVTNGIYKCKDYYHAASLNEIKENDARYTIEKVLASTDINLQITQIPSDFVEEFINSRGEKKECIIGDIKFIISNAIDTKRLKFCYHEPNNVEDNVEAAKRIVQKHFPLLKDSNSLARITTMVLEAMEWQATKG